MRVTVPGTDTVRARIPRKVEGERTVMAAEGTGSAAQKWKWVMGICNHMCFWVVKIEARINKSMKEAFKAVFPTCIVVGVQLWGLKM